MIWIVIILALVIFVGLREWQHRRELKDLRQQYATSIHRGIEKRTLIRRMYNRQLDDELRRNNKLVRDYHALEIGRDEESEAYQQEILSYMDVIVALEGQIHFHRQEIEELKHALKKHWLQCLPSYQFFVDSEGVQHV